MQDRSGLDTATESGVATSDRFNWLERRGGDFPYCNGRPVEITGGQWWLAILVCPAAALPFGAAPAQTSGLPRHGNTQYR